MNPNKASPLFVFLPLLLLLFSFSPLSVAFNITRLLNQHPDFSNFNDLLTQTGVAAAINSRRTITVLVVDNGSMGAVSEKPQTTIRNILATHVILDYYDRTKLGELSKKSTLLTTLFQTTGIAGRMQGFLNITRLSTGEVVVGSAVNGADRNSKLMAVVAAQPYNISVIQISQAIIAPGIDQSGAINFSSSPPPKMAEAPAAATPPSAESETPTDAPAETPVADAPLAPNQAAEAPAEAAASASSPAPAPAPAEETDADHDAAETSPKVAADSSAGRRMTSCTLAGGAVIGLFAAAFMMAF
ncbi:hypothetical protein Dimus_020271 [Dionaea muscipula]